MKGRPCGTAGVCTAVAWAAWVAACGGSGVAAEPPQHDRAAILRAAVTAGERVWNQVAAADPPPDFSARWPLSYAVALCDAGVHLDRVPRLLDLASRMQDRDPDSRDFGNFRWYWRDAGVTDANAVDFCGLDLNLLWRLHRERLPEPARRSLEDLARRAVEGCLRHKVRPSYTNIAILNAANLIGLGEALEIPTAADEGYRRLEAMAVDTWRFGLHEYASPVYYAIDIEGLLAIERFAARESGRDLARLLLELIWTDIAANWFPPAARLAGPHSRSYDYLHGGGGLVHHLRWQGWMDGPLRGGTHVIHLLDGRWRPAPGLLELASTRFPRLVRQSWGPLAAESRTHWLLGDVTLGCSGAGYGPDDSALTFDLPGSSESVRGYFIPDGRGDPYGRVRYPTGRAGHPKPLHLRPFWAGAQRTSDALGLVVYRDADLEPPEVSGLESHVVLPRDVDGWWLRGRPLAIDDLTGTADHPVRVVVEPGDPLVLRKGSAAVGLRFVWTRARDGGPGAIAVVGDGNPWNALRLTVDHRLDAGAGQAAAALWVRVGGGLDDAAFTAWRVAFERAEPAAVEVSADRIRVAVTGVDGPVSLAAAAPFSQESTATLEPRPARAVLEIDGVDVGRAILERVEPFRGYAARLAADRIVHVPATGGASWEAESGLVLPSMAEVDDTEASGKRSVVATAAPAGSVAWRLDVARAGRHWLWARVRAPDPSSDSVWIVVTDGSGRQITRAAWHLPRTSTWTWAAAKLDRAAAPTPLDLPAGPIEVRLEPREPGAAVDAVWITGDPAGRPPEAAPGGPGLTPPGSGPR